MGSGPDKLTIDLQQPRGGWTAGRMVQIAGKVSDPTVDPITVSINGEKYLLRTNSGAFDRQFPITAGKNAVIVSGRNAKGLVSVSRSIYAAVSPVAIKAVLTSDTDHVYTDLHIYEPNQNLKNSMVYQDKYFEHIYWARTESPSGGHFYLNEQSGSYDQPGYGPYLYTHSAPPLGFYRIDTNYWPSGDKAQVAANLDLVLFGGTPNEIKRKVNIPLVKSGDTITLAWVKIEKGQRAAVYIPSQDKLTLEQTKRWPSWVLNYNPKDRAKDTSGDYGD